MTTHDKMIELYDQHYYRLMSNGTVRACDISDKQLNNAKKSFAPGVERGTIIGFLDTSVMGNGKNGYLFTDEKVYYLETLEKPKKLWYDDIQSVHVTDISKPKDCDRTLVFNMKDGSTQKWTSILLNKTPLCQLFEGLIEMDSGSNDEANMVNYRDERHPAKEAGGLGIAGYGNVNKLFEEEKFHAQQGHGFAAERANDLYDKATGHKATILGDDNAKNGADRMVDGVYIQSKYCETGSRCISECFEDGGSGSFRYMIDGKPMQIEVPSDQYDAAVEAMKRKIQNGQVPGVSDPKEAENIVRKGHFTYAQARNIAKAGTVESIKYDAANGVVIASSAFGVTAILTFATSLWNGDDFNTSLKTATYSGLKVGGTAFVTSILSSQLSKAGLNSALVNGSEAVVRFMGPKASAFLINAFRNGAKPIYGAAAMKSAAKLLRGNVITAGVTVVVLSTADVVNIFRGRISGKQLLKNLANTTGTVAGGTAGWIGGAAAGTAIFPGVGTVIGGLLGSIAAGAIAGKATDAVTGLFAEDDADEMVRILQNVFQKVAEEYLLNSKEGEKCVDRLSEKLNAKTLKDMYASESRSAFARNLIVPIVEKRVVQRDRITLPSRDEMILGLREVLEEIADAEIVET